LPKKIIKNAFIDNGTCLGNPIKVNPATVGLWTGLNDKNGLKIFEGDRVESIWRVLEGTVKFGTFHEMYENIYTDLQHGFYVEDDNGDTGSIYGANGVIWFEIIDSIHDEHYV